MSLPMGCQISVKNWTVLPSLMTIHTNFLAIYRSCSSFRQTQDPETPSLTSQKELPQSSIRLTHSTHKESAFSKIRQISFRANTVETSLILRTPKPPSCFNLQTSGHAIFAFVVMLGELLHKKAEHMLSISSIQPCVRHNEEHQKLVIMAISIAISPHTPGPCLSSWGAVP